MIFSLICWLPLNLQGQKNVPKNLKQTVKYLDRDFTDSFRLMMRQTDIKVAQKVRYPRSGEYNTIYNWVNEQQSGISKYLRDRGIVNFQVEVILDNYKRHLNHETISEDSLLKPYRDVERKWAVEEKTRTTADTIKGIYIPKDLEDCFVQLNFFWEDSTQKKIKSWSEREFTGKLHLGFGMWMRNNWQLWGGSRLSEYFDDLGISHPDDMTGIILVSYHRRLNGKEIRLEEQVKYYQDYWEETRIERGKRTQEEFSEFKIGDTLEFKYNWGFVSKKQEDKYDNDHCAAKGVITGRNETEFLIKVRVIEDCDKRGIVYYDNKDYEMYDSQTGKRTAPQKRIIKKVKAGEEQWFAYDDWYP